MRYSPLAFSAVHRLRGATAERLYLATGIDRTRPTSIQALVNERCNYRCRYCGYWRKPALSGEPYDEEMTLDEWKRAVESLHDFVGRHPIRFLGGEPFLKRGFVELLEHTHAVGMEWTVCTNGSALARRAVAERVAAARPFHVDLSVDSPDTRVNDHLRGIEGGLRAVERAIANLRAARASRRASFPIRIKPVVTATSFRQLPALVEWAREVGADSIDLNPVRPWTPEVERELWLDTEEELSELAAVVETLVRLRRRGAPIETPVAKLRSFPAHFRRERVRHGALPCRVGMREFLIRTNGDVELCWFHPVVGNIREAGAREIWNGERARRIRAQTVRCTRFGTVHCANSCLAHKSLRQEIGAGLGRIRRARHA